MGAVVIKSESPKRVIRVSFNSFSHGIRAILWPFSVLRLRKRQIEDLVDQRNLQVTLFCYPHLVPSKNGPLPSMAGEGEGNNAHLSPVTHPE